MIARDTFAGQVGSAFRVVGGPFDSVELRLAELTDGKAAPGYEVFSLFFHGPAAPVYVRQLLSPESLRKAGYFDPAGVARWQERYEAALTDGKVISVTEEFALVVANLGREHGVKLGMPFQIWRGEERIGLVRVVDVRDKISGAVIQDLNGKKTKIQAGDRLKVDAQL